MLSVESCNIPAKYELVLHLLFRVKGQPALHDISNLEYLKMCVPLRRYFVTDRDIWVRLCIIIWKTCGSFTEKAQPK